MAWNKPTSNTVDATSSSRPSGRGKMPRLRRDLLAGAIVVLGAGLAAWLFMGGEADSRPLQKKDRGLIKEVTPAVAPTNVVTLTAEDRERLAHPGMVKSSTGVWQPTNRPWRAGSRKVHNVHTNGLNRKRGPVPYHNATEQALFQLFTRELGDAPMPLLRLPKKDMENLAGILISKAPVEADDTEGIALGKDIINRAKDELRKYIREGGDVQDFFEHYHNQLQMAYERRVMAQKEIRRILREDKDRDLAKQLMERVNEDFKKEGIRPVRVDLSEDDD